MEYSAIQTSNARAAFPSFTIARAALLPALDVMARHIIAKRGSVPILANVRIDASPCGHVIITATNLDLELTATLPAEIETPGSFTLPCVILRDLVKKGDSGREIRFCAGDGRATITAGRVTQSLPMLPAADFPAPIQMGQATLSAEFDAIGLADDWRRVSVAISTEETRYYLNGINFSIEAGKLCATATDGHRLALIERDASEMVADEFEHAILPRLALPAALAVLKMQGEGRATLEFSASKFQLDCGALILRGKLIDGTFPDYRRVIPDAACLQNSIAINSAEMLDHVAAAMKQEGKVKPLSVEIEGHKARAGVAGPDGYVRPLAGESTAADCRFAFDACYMAAFAKMGGTIELRSHSIDGGNDGAPMLIKFPEMPEFTAVLMPVRCGEDLPKPRAVTYPDIKPAPGRAAGLFDLEKYDAARCGPIGKPKPRVATARECIAYLTDFAARCGLPDLGNSRLVAGGDIPHGVTFGEIEQERTEYPEKWSGRQGWTKDFSKPQHIAGRYADGAYSIPMPGRRQAPVMVQFADDAGEYGEPMACTDAKGNIALPDAPKERKRKAAKAAKPAPVAPPISEPATAVPISDEFAPSYRELPNGEYQTSDERGNIWLHRRDGSQVLVHDETGDAMAKEIEHARMMQEAAAAFVAEFLPAQEPQAPQEPLESISEPDATQAAPIAEIAPQDEKNALPDDDAGQGDAIAALVARLDALEQAVSALQSPPSVEMPGNPPISEKPKRTAAHVRAIMAYLAMRKGRRQLCADRDDWQAIAEQNAARIDELRRDLASQIEESEYQDRKKREYKARAESLAGKRRRAVLKARDMQNQLKAERKLAERYRVKREKAEENARDWSRKEEIERCRANAAERELADLKRKLADPANPWRESDIFTIRDQAATFQERAARAEAESQRLRNLALQNAGHIETLASRVAKAESMLREQGLWPALAVVPPAVQIAA